MKMLQSDIPQVQMVYNGLNHLSVIQEQIKLLENNTIDLFIRIYLNESLLSIEKAKLEIMDGLVEIVNDRLYESNKINNSLKEIEKMIKKL
jgi:hypothetical protein